MAGLIVKSPYIKGGGGGYLRYIATRERVEILPDGRPPTRKQEQLITKLVKDFSNVKELPEYAEYTEHPSKANASAFATDALEHGMDVKTLSTVIGHVSCAATLNVYAHVTDEMRQRAADKIDRAIAGAEPQASIKEGKAPGKTAFQPVKGKYRKPGTGCISRINDRLWEGRYSSKVNGKRMARNVYAKTEAECEEKLVRMIREMKEEFAALRKQKAAG